MQHNPASNSGFATGKSYVYRRDDAIPSGGTRQARAIGSAIREISSRPPHLGAPKFLEALASRSIFATCPGTASPMSPSWSSRTSCRDFRSSDRIQSPSMKIRLLPRDRSREIHSHPSGSSGGSVAVRRSYRQLLVQLVEERRQFVAEDAVGGASPPSWAKGSRSKSSGSMVSEVGHVVADHHQPATLFRAELSPVRLLLGQPEIEAQPDDRRAGQLLVLADGETDQRDDVGEDLAALAADLALSSFS